MILKNEEVLCRKPASCQASLGAKAKEFEVVSNHWPPEWDESAWKPSDYPIRNLVKAGDLIAAGDRTAPKTFVTPP